MSRELDGPADREWHPAGENGIGRHDDEMAVPGGVHLREEDVGKEHRMLPGPSDIAETGEILYPPHAPSTRLGRSAELGGADGDEFEGATASRDDQRTPWLDAQSIAGCEEHGNHAQRRRDQRPADAAAAWHLVWRAQRVRRGRSGGQMCHDSACQVMPNAPAHLRARLKRIDARMLRHFPED